MGYKAEIRAGQAAQRRQQRDAQKHLRELERRAKDQANLSAIEQAKLEVETHENRLQLLLSVHKEQGPVWDWTAVAASLPPYCPQKTSYHELRAKLQSALLPPDTAEAAAHLIEQAKAQDDKTYQCLIEEYDHEKDDWAKLKSLSRRILSGDPHAYREALVEISPLAEISDLGSTIHFTVHDIHLLECVLKVKSVEVIPAEVKTVTSTGKLSVKPMPKARFHELFQDYICSCMLRVAREAFAILPIDKLLITATADATNLCKSQDQDQPVLSAIMPRTALARLDFEQLDPSDAVESFKHRGDFKATRKTGAFAPITPLKPADAESKASETPPAVDLLLAVRCMREDLRADIAKLTRANSTPNN